MATRKQPTPDEPRPGRPCRDGGDEPQTMVSFRLTRDELARLDRRRKKAPRSNAIREALVSAGLI